MVKYIVTIPALLYLCANAYADSADGTGYYVSVPYSFPWIVMGVIFAFIALPLVIGMFAYIMYDKKRKPKKTSGDK